MNDVAYRILGLQAAHDRHRPALHRRAASDEPDIIRMVAGAFELSHLPNRAELRLKSTGKVIGYTLSQVRDAQRRGHRRDAVLQGPDPRRAARGARAPARPAGGARRDGGRDRPRSQESARRHRGHGRAAEAAAAGLAGRADDARRHHQGSEDGQRHRPRGARVRAADPAPGRARVARRRHHAMRSRCPRAAGRAATSRWTSTLPADLPAIQGDPHQLRQIFTNLLINAYEALNGRGTVRIVATDAAGRGPAGRRRRRRADRRCRSR